MVAVACSLPLGTHSIAAGSAMVSLIEVKLAWFTAMCDVVADLGLCSLQKLMISMKVRVTPTFKLFRESECVHSHGGINEGTLRSAIEEYQALS